MHNEREVNNYSAQWEGIRAPSEGGGRTIAHNGEWGRKNSDCRGWRKNYSSRFLERTIVPSGGM